MTATTRRSVRCAIYTRVSTELASIRTSTHLMPNMMRRRPISAVRPMPVGPWFATDMTMAVSRADPPTAPALQQLLDDIRADRINSLSSIRSIG